MVNFASGAGLFGNYGQCSYAAAKEGIRGLTRVAANEWGKDGINVNIVCPLAWTAALETSRMLIPRRSSQRPHAAGRPLRRRREGNRPRGRSALRSRL